MIESGTFRPSSPAAIAEPSSGVIPPHNIEAEQALLGAILVTNKAYERVGSQLRPEHFSENVHGRIYAAITTLIERGSVANPVTLKRIFDQDAALAEIGGAEYLGRLACSVVTIINVHDYARTIIDCWQRRQIIEAAVAAIEGASGGDLHQDANTVREELEGRLLSLQDATGQRDSGPRSLAEFGAAALETANRAYRRQGRTTGVATGLADLDRITGGLQPSDLIYLAGRPSMGKSALAGTIALNAARNGHPVFLASPEMSGEQVALRVLSIRAALSSQNIRSGQVTGDDIDRLVAVQANEFPALPFIIEDRGGISLPMLRSRVRRFMLQAHKIKGAGTIDGAPATPLVIVDYIQLMATEQRKGQSRNDDMSELSRGLKALAKEFGVPVVALSQLSRAVESRENKRPMLSDLRDSGSLEQDADVVAFIYREEYYLSREEPGRRQNETATAYENRFADWQARLDQVRNTAEVIIGKQRHGATGKAVLRFDPETTSFENLARDRWSYSPQSKAAP